jgi:AraC-like DNA-binding protein
MDAKYKPEDTAAMGRAQQKLGAFRSVPALLANFGVDPSNVLREFGLDEQMMQSPHAVARAASVNRLLIACAELTGCPHFGLLVGQANNLDALGPVGPLARSARDVGGALRGIVTTFKFHNGAAMVWLDVRPEFAALHYCIYEPRYEPSTQLYAGTSAAIRNILSELCGPGWSPLAVHLPFRRPLDIWPYRSCLRAPLVFDADTVAIRFEPRWLEQPLRTADPQVHAQLEQHFRTLDALGDADFPSIVRRLIRRQLLVSKCHADDIATALAIHRRTFDRRLEAEDTTFQELHDAVRHDLARQLLRETSLSVRQIAGHLLYNSVANFSTAFRRWSGITPRDYRGASL